MMSFSPEKPNRLWRFCVSRVVSVQWVCQPRPPQPQPQPQPTAPVPRGKRRSSRHVIKTPCSSFPPFSSHVPPATGATCREKKDSSPRRSFFYRVLRAAFPLQLLLLFLLLLPCLIPLAEDAPGCTGANNFARSFYPMLRYTNGPPPTWPPPRRLWLPLAEGSQWTERTGFSDWPKGLWMIEKVSVLRPTMKNSPWTQKRCGLKPSISAPNTM